MFAGTSPTIVEELVRDFEKGTPRLDALLGYLELKLTRWRFIVLWHQSHAKRVKLENENRSLRSRRELSR